MSEQASQSWEEEEERTSSEMHSRLVAVEETVRLRTCNHVIVASVTKIFTCSLCTCVCVQLKEILAVLREQRPDPPPPQVDAGLTQTGRKRKRRWDSSCFPALRNMAPSLASTLKGSIIRK